MEAPSRHKVLERRTGRSLCVEFPICRYYQQHREIAAAVELLTGKQFGVEATCVQVDASGRGMDTAAVQLRGVEGRDAEIELGIKHADAVFGDAKLAHPRACNSLRRLVVAQGEIPGVPDRIGVD